ncbi:6-phosphofructokinase [Roseburia sp. MSJ-14]|uniref:6-phosphofructokinase n=1 Tax=Roseburia sp. MSJ-14 TaxID=2841514 RepID=UPI001C10FEC0|nr:6-phosphofructokinase [Roseburia sp. MSJ-14]MBU5474033.1 6-phosphofructokinase [Roseburia sp. MSJ-14]
MKNCFVAQSGGPTAAINASLAGVIKGVLEHSDFDRIYGSLNGITGILEGRYLDLTDIFQKEETLNLLKRTPAMYLGSCRFKLPKPEDDIQPYQFIFEKFAEMNIGAFFYIGGNDSMDTVDKLSAYGASIGSDIRVIGIPKTIDNDLCATDHTPGFGSAAKYVASSILEISHDTLIYHVKSVTIVEIMGRDAGWLTAASALARNEYSTAPHLIYLPERDFDTEAFLADVSRLLQERDNVIIAVSEGIRDKDGNYISASAGAVDNFGHSQLSGAGKALEYLVQERLHVKVRSVEVNILQRCGGHIASLTDLDESFAQGEFGVTLAGNGETGKMVTLSRTSNTPYAVSYSATAIADIANKVKSVPMEYINAEGNDVTSEMMTYLKPLIQGEPVVDFKDGLPVYLPVAHLV